MVTTIHGKDTRLAKKICEKDVTIEGGHNCLLSSPIYTYLCAAGSNVMLHTAFTACHKYSISGTFWAVKPLLNGTWS